MTYSAAITDRNKQEDEAGFAIAHESGFPDRKAAWAWVIDEAKNRWPDSPVVSEIEEYSRTDVQGDEPAQRGMDFGSPEGDLEIAVLINDEDLFDDPAPWMRKD